MNATMAKYASSYTTDPTDFAFVLARELVPFAVVVGEEFSAEAWFLPTFEMICRAIQTGDVTVDFRHARVTPGPFLTTSRSKRVKSSVIGVACVALPSGPLRDSVRYDDEALEPGTLASLVGDRRNFYQYLPRVSELPHVYRVNWAYFIVMREARSDDLLRVT